MTRSFIRMLLITSFTREQYSCALLLKTKCGHKHLYDHHVLHLQTPAKNNSRKYCELVFRSCRAATRGQWQGRTNWRNCDSCFQCIHLLQARPLINQGQKCRACQRVQRRLQRLSPIACCTETLTSLGAGRNLQIRRICDCRCALQGNTAR